MSNPLTPFQLALKTDPQEGIRSANELLNRKIPSNYLQEWSSILAHPKMPSSPSEIPLVIFRLGQEWFALSTLVFKQVVQVRSVHSVPHKKGAVLRGLVNISGQIRLCISLDSFFEIQTKNDPDMQKDENSRMIVIEKEGETWVFKTEDVFGCVCIEKKHVQALPVTLSKSVQNYFKGVFEWNLLHVGLIDEELLFFGLKREVL